MPSHADRTEFTPPPQPGLLRALALALLAHLLLLAALTWGVHWRRQAQDVAVEAELWSTVPQQQPAPPAPPPPTTPPPAPVSALPKAVETPRPSPQPRAADITIEREKQKQPESKPPPRPERPQQPERAKQQARANAVAQQASAEKAAAEQRRREAQRKAQEEAQRKAEAEEQEAVKRLEAQRRENMRHLAKLAEATGDGSAARSSGPSASYGARLAALFKRNIVFPDRDGINGNPKTVVEVSVGPSGLIMSARLAKSSGNAAWDAAALRAIEKTRRIPPDDNGRFVPVFPVEFGPKD